MSITKRYFASLFNMRSSLVDLKNPRVSIAIVVPAFHWWWVDLNCRIGHRSICDSNASESAAPLMSIFEKALSISRMSLDVN
jgi:hypothetical protein